MKATRAAIGSNYALCVTKWWKWGMPLSPRHLWQTNANDRYCLYPRPLCFTRGTVSCHLSNIFGRNEALQMGWHHKGLVTCSLLICFNELLDCLMLLHECCGSFISMGPEQWCASTQPGREEKKLPWCMRTCLAIGITSHPICRLLLHVMFKHPRIWLTFKTLNCSPN